MIRSNIVYLHPTEPMHGRVSGVEVTELPWEDSAWLFEQAAGHPLEKWPTLVNWHVSLSGCLDGQILHHPYLSYGSTHKTERIVEVRNLQYVQRAIAFAADGQCYRLGEPNEEHNHRTLAREWKAMMLAASKPVSCLDEPTISLGRRDVFGLQRPS